VEVSVSLSTAIDPAGTLIFAVPEFNAAATEE
jgi:hypothetical protein